MLFGSIQRRKLLAFIWFNGLHTSEPFCRVRSLNVSILTGAEDDSLLVGSIGD